MTDREVDGPCRLVYGKYRILSSKNSDFGVACFFLPIIKKVELIQEKARLIVSVVIYPRH